MGLQGAPLAAASKVVAAFDDALARLAAKTIDIAVADVVWYVSIRPRRAVPVRRSIRADSDGGFAAQQVHPAAAVVPVSRG
jgi:hypothetical protein